MCTIYTNFIKVIKILSQNALENSLISKGGGQLKKYCRKTKEQKRKKLKNERKGKEMKKKIFLTHKKVFTFAAYVFLQLG